MISNLSEASRAVSESEAMDYYPYYYRVKDKFALDSRHRITEASLRKYVRGAKLHPSYGLIREAKAISMLHEEVLLLLRYFVLSSSGGVLEIGPYVGGSTVMIAETVKKLGKGPFVSVEVGGRHDHPEIPSANIFGDLERNIERFGVSDSVRLLNGHSNEDRIRQQVHFILAEEGISLLVFDADGEVGRDFNLYSDLLNDGAALVFDDYTGPDEKSSLVKEWVDKAVSNGTVLSFGTWGWGTWIGMYKANLGEKTYTVG